MPGPPHLSDNAYPWSIAAQSLAHFVEQASLLPIRRSDAPQTLNPHIETVLAGLLVLDHGLGRTVDRSVLHWDLALALVDCLAPRTGVGRDADLPELVGVINDLDDRVASLLPALTSGHPTYGPLAELHEQAHYALTTDTP